jgi:hypothetical protein
VSVLDSFGSGSGVTLSLNTEPDPGGQLIKLITYPAGFGSYQIGN